jgi:hypothetical protein
MKGLAVTVLFGFVGYVLSWGLFVPSDLRPFNVIGVVASMAGYALGTQANSVKGWARVTLIIASALVSVGCVISYVIHVQRGSGDAFEIIRLAALLFGGFFALTFLMPLAGVSIERNWAAKI